MQQFNFFHPLALAFYSKPLYRDVGENWRGRGFLYLLFISALLCVASFFLYYSVSKVIVAHLQPMVAQLPTITVKEGKVSIDKAVPYTIKSPGQETIAIIDTSGQLNSLEGSEAWILLTQDKLLLKEGKDQTTPYDLSTLSDRVYTPEIMQNYLKRLLPALTWILFILDFALIFAGSVIGVLILAGLAKLLTHTTLSYKTICRLAAIAMTPALVLSTVLAIAHIKLPYAWLIYFPLTMAYLLYGIEANKKEGALMES